MSDEEYVKEIENQIKLCQEQLAKTDQTDVIFYEGIKTEIHQLEMMLFRKNNPYPWEIKK